MKKVKKSVPNVWGLIDLLKMLTNQKNLKTFSKKPRFFPALIVMSFVVRINNLCSICN